MDVNSVVDVLANVERIVAILILSRRIKMDDLV